MEWGGDFDKWSDEKLECSYMITSRARELETGKPVVPISTAIAELEASLEAEGVDLPPLPARPPNRIPSLAVGPPESLPE